MSMSKLNVNFIHDYDGIIPFSQLALSTKCFICGNKNYSIIVKKTCWHKYYKFITVELITKELNTITNEENINK